MPPRLPPIRILRNRDIFPLCRRNQPTERDVVRGFVRPSCFSSSLSSLSFASGYNLQRFERSPEFLTVYWTNYWVSKPTLLLRAIAKMHPRFVRASRALGNSLKKCNDSFIFKDTFDPADFPNCIPPVYLAILISLISLDIVQFRINDNKKSSHLTIYYSR